MTATAKPRTVAALMYEAHAGALPDGPEDLPFDLLEPDKQAPWIAAATAAERAFLDGLFAVGDEAEVQGADAIARQGSALRQVQVAIDPAKFAGDQAEDLARYFRTTAARVIRLTRPSREQSLVLTNLEQAWLWLGQAIR